jgi:hypothetical protein
MMPSNARSNKDGAGADRRHRATQESERSSSRKEEERQGQRSREQMAVDRQEGQSERENAGRDR